jgi:chemotaxis protein CheC
MPQTHLSARHHDLLYRAVEAGARHAASGLAGMIGRPVTATTRTIALVPLVEVIARVGGADTPTTGVYLGLRAGLRGHILLLLADDAARALADLVLDHAVGTTVVLGEMERSALQEAGNITSSYFLTSLAAATGLTIQPTPPVLVADMCGAILDAPVAVLALESDEALFIETEFCQAEHSVHGLFLVLPDQASLATLLGRLA